jgi:hypothetical protein
VANALRNQGEPASAKLRFCIRGLEDVRACQHVEGLDGFVVNMRRNA